MTKAHFPLSLKTAEKDLVMRVMDSINAGDSYFLVFHTAFGDLMNTSSRQRNALMQKPIYRILESIVEKYRTDPTAYKR